MIARLAAIAALAGSVAGATVVLADEPAPARKVKAIASPEPTPTPTPIPARDAHVVVQTPDTEGGPAWAMRQFETTFEPVKLPKHMRRDPAAKEWQRRRIAQCYEVGRLQGEQFGWIDGRGAFRATAPGHAATPGTCATPQQLKQAGAITQRFATVTYAASGSPQPARTITWGVTAPDVKAIHPAGEPAIVATGPFLRVAQGESRTALLAGVVERADGTRTVINEFAGYRGERPVPGTGQVAARAPDPAGGEPWALIASRGERGGVCFGSPGRLVGTHLGRIDRRLDTFYADPFATLEANCKRKAPTRAFPLRLDTLISGRGVEDEQGRIERRIIEGRIVFSGRVHRDVVSVTITTPRDVRTLIPTKDHHAIIAVYAGLFPGGKATATAHFRDGREVTRTLYVE